MLRAFSIFWQSHSLTVLSSDPLTKNKLSLLTDRQFTLAVRNGNEMEENNNETKDTKECRTQISKPV